MTQQPGPGLDELRDAVAAQLSEWRTVVSGDTFGFTRAGGGHAATTISARSCLRPDSNLLAEIGRRRADNDGTFDQPGPVHMVTLALTVDQAAASGEDIDKAVDYWEATAWRNVLLPRMTWCYVLEDPSEPGALAARSWFFTLFLGTQDQPLPAPADFDWVAHRVRYRGLLVSLVDDDGRRVETVYENPRFPRFYHSYTEARGRYWDIEVNQPPADAGITRCFDVLAKALARRAAIAEVLRPMSLSWQQGNRVELVLRDDQTRRCYGLELTVPTDADIDRGDCLLPAEPGGLSAALVEPEQYAAGQVHRLRELGRNEIIRHSIPTDCRSDETHWHQVVRADGTPASCHAGSAVDLLRTEGAPMRGSRVDMTRARWNGPPDHPGIDG